MPTTTPSMNLVLPDVGITAGPLWATMLNQAFTDIDVHDHAPGRGVLITPSGLNINSDLSINSNNLTLARSVALDNQGAFLPSSDLRRVYVKGGDLFYNNNLGQPVQITSGTTIYISGGGGIGGDYGKPGVQAAVTYSDITKTYLFTQSPGVTGSMAQGPTTFFENTMASNGVTVGAPTALSASYSLFLFPSLPTTPANNFFVTLDSTGALKSNVDSRTDGTIFVSDAASAGSFIKLLSVNSFHRGTSTFTFGVNDNKIPQGTTFTIDSAAGSGPNNSEIVWDTTRQSMVYTRPDPTGLIVNQQSAEFVPVGAGMDYFGATEPIGWFFADGRALSRTTYSALFAAYGTTWGIGDGSTTFNIPDKRGRVTIAKGTGPANYLGDTNPTLTARTNGTALGRETHVLTTGELATHTHIFTGDSTGMNGDHAHLYSQYNHAMYGDTTPAFPEDILTNFIDVISPRTTTTAGLHVHTTSGTNANTGSNTAHNNMQPVLVCNYIIKY